MEEGILIFKDAEDFLKAIGKLQENYNNSKSNGVVENEQK